MGGFFDRHIALALGISVLLHVAPLLLFTVRMPEVNRTETVRVDLALLSGGVDTGVEVVPPPMRPAEVEVGGEWMAPAQAETRRMQATAMTPPVRLPKALSVSPDQLALSRRPVLRPRAPHLPDQAGQSLAERGLPRGLPDREWAIPPPERELPDVVARPEIRREAPETEGPDTPEIVEGTAGLRQRPLLQSPKPAYPAGETRSARVRLRFSVLPDGSVIDVRVEQRGGPAFDRAAVEALRRWRFEPVSLEVGEPEEAVQWGRVLMHFKVQSPAEITAEARPE